MSVKPEEIPIYDVLSYGQMGGSVQTLSGGVAEAGKIYAAPDGKRFYYNNVGDYSLYVLVDEWMPQGNLGKAYIQKRSDFASDVSVGGTAADISNRLKATQAVIKSFLELYMGVLSCAGGPLAFAITGMKVVVTAGHIKQNYKTYQKGIEALYYYMAYCNTKTPTLSISVFDQLLWASVRNRLSSKSKDLLSGAIPGPKISGKIAGVFLGAVGEDQVQLRLKAINGLIKEVLVKVAKHQQDHYGQKLSPEQVSQLAKHVNKQLALCKASVSQSTAEQIIREVAENCFHVRKPLADIADALTVLGEAG